MNEVARMDDAVRVVVTTGEGDVFRERRPPRFSGR
jgi:hypothetical protein